MNTRLSILLLAALAAGVTHADAETVRLAGLLSPAEALAKLAELGPSLQYVAYCTEVAKRDIAIEAEPDDALRLTAAAFGLQIVRYGGVFVIGPGRQQEPWDDPVDFLAAVASAAPPSYEGVLGRFAEAAEEEAKATDDGEQENEPGDAARLVQRVARGVAGEYAGGPAAWLQERWRELAARPDKPAEGQAAVPVGEGEADLIRQAITADSYLRVIVDVLVAKAILDTSRPLRVVAQSRPQDRLVALDLVFRQPSGRLANLPLGSTLAVADSPAAETALCAPYPVSSRMGRAVGLLRSVDSSGAGPGTVLDAALSRSTGLQISLAAGGGQWAWRLDGQPLWLALDAAGLAAGRCWRPTNESWNIGPSPPSVAGAMLTASSMATRALVWPSSRDRAMGSLPALECWRTLSGSRPPAGSEFSVPWKEVAPDSQPVLLRMVLVAAFGRALQRAVVDLSDRGGTDLASAALIWRPGEVIGDLVLARPWAAKTLRVPIEAAADNLEGERDGRLGESLSSRPIGTHRLAFW